MPSTRRKNRRGRSAVIILPIVAAAAAGGWWYYDRYLQSGRSPTPAGAAEANPAEPLVVEVPEGAFAGPPEPVAPPPVPTHEERADDQPDVAHAARQGDELLEPQGPGAVGTGQAASALGPGSALSQTEEDLPPTDNPAVAKARALYQAGKVIEARHALNTLLQGRLSPADDAEVRRLLTRIADETIFSSRRFANDPLVDAYHVRPGDNLISIGREYQVPSEILMRINGIRDARRLRADATIKVLRGPFHVKIYKSRFRMDVYLQNLYVRSFRVGLGADQGTPEGVWKVKERLENPTYYPPASAIEKRIIPADDPANPLGEYWIGLEGVSGDAVGRVGYGIHGTIEPESIGKAVSLGCVRMLNEDVAFLYGLLLPGKSTVTILP